MSSFGSTPSYAESITLPQIMDRLKDNLNNEVSAEDVRWTAFSLWDKMEQVESSLSEFKYDNADASTVSVGGIQSGTTFNDKSLTSLLNDMFYPMQAPILSLTFGTLQNPKELGSLPSVSVSYSITKKSNNIIGIDVQSTSITAPASPQAFDTVISGSLILSVPINVPTSIAMTVTSGVNTINTKTLDLVWLNSMYVLGMSFNASYDLTTFPNHSTTVSSIIETNLLSVNSNFITKDITVSGTISSSIPGALRSKLLNSKNSSYSNIGGGNKHIVFAFPTSFGTPIFEVNGMTNTAFTKVVSNKPLLNLSGYSLTNYDVWISNTAQNSPLNSIKIN